MPNCYVVFNLNYASVFIVYSISQSYFGCHIYTSSTFNLKSFLLITNLCFCFSVAEGVFDGVMTGILSTGSYLLSKISAEDENGATLSAPIICNLRKRTETLHI